MQERSIVIMCVGILITLGAPLTVEAQESGLQEAASEAAGSPQSGAEVYRFAEDIQDLQVLNALGQEIGDISRIIIRGDRVTHAIISIGGFVGLGGSEIVVPFDVLAFDGEQATIDTLASADQIEELTLFDPADFGLSE